jgi:hypothetical protein
VLKLFARKNWLTFRGQALDAPASFVLLIVFLGYGYLGQRVGPFELYWSEQLPIVVITATGVGLALGGVRFSSRSDRWGPLIVLAAWMSWLILYVIVIARALRRILDAGMPLYDW